MWIKSYLINSVVFPTQKQNKTKQNNLKITNNVVEEFLIKKNPRIPQKLRFRLAALYSDVTP
jgi:hypothetical protein